MGARWYDPAIGRFTQADTIIPDPGEPIAWDRYHYARNSPLRYIDPTGHSYYDPGCECMVVGDTPEIEYYFHDQNLAYDYRRNYNEHDYSWIEVLMDYVDRGLDPSTEIAMSMVAEPLDWIITIGECNQSGDCGLGTYALMFAWGSTSFWRRLFNKGEDTITLFRAVGNAELDDILSSGKFQPHPGGLSMDGKFFSETYEGAMKWGEAMYDEFHIVAVTVSVDVANLMEKFDNLDTFANARFASAASSLLDKFNDAASSITKVFSSGR